MKPKAEKKHVIYSSIVNTIVGAMICIIGYFGAGALSDLRHVKEDIQNIKTNYIVKNLNDSFKNLTDHLVDAYQQGGLINTDPEEVSPTLH